MPSAARAQRERGADVGVRERHEDFQGVPVLVQGYLLQVGKPTLQTRVVAPRERGRDAQRGGGNLLRVRGARDGVSHRAVGGTAVSAETCLLKAE